MSEDRKNKIKNILFTDTLAEKHPVAWEKFVDYLIEYNYHSGDSHSIDIKEFLLYPFTMQSGIFIQFLDLNGYYTSTNQIDYSWIGYIGNEHIEGFFESDRNSMLKIIIFECFRRISMTKEEIRKFKINKMFNEKGQ